MSPLREVKLDFKGMVALGGCRFLSHLSPFLVLGFGWPVERSLEGPSGLRLRNRDEGRISRSVRVLGSPCVSFITASFSLLILSS